MKDTIRRIVRPALQQLRRSANKAGYDIVRIPESGSTNAQAPDVFLNSVREAGDVRYIEPASLRNLPNPDSQTTDRYLSLFLERTNNIKGHHNFPILGSGDKSSSVLERVTSYVDRSRMSAYVSILDWCLKCGLDLNTADVIDVGTGVGVLPFVLKDRWKRAVVVGCDANRDYVELAAALFPEIEFQYQPLTSVTRQYDVVFFTEILEHMANPYYAAEQLRRIVKPTGKIIVTVPDGRRDQMESMNFIPAAGSYGGHVNFWSIESWVSFLQNAFVPAKIWAGCKSGSTLYACIEPTE